MIPCEISIAQTYLLIYLSMTFSIAKWPTEATNVYGQWSERMFYEEEWKWLSLRNHSEFFNHFSALSKMPWMFDKQNVSELWQDIVRACNMKLQKETYERMINLSGDTEILKNTLRSLFLHTEL